MDTVVDFLESTRDFTYALRILFNFIGVKYILQEIFLPYIIPIFNIIYLLYSYWWIPSILAFMKLNATGGGLYVLISSYILIDIGIAVGLYYLQIFTYGTIGVSVFVLLDWFYLRVHVFDAFRLDKKEE